MSGFLEFLAGCWNSGEEGLLDRSEKRSYIFFAHCSAVKKEKQLDLKNKKQNYKQIENKQNH